jgi:hypothetical protein
MGTRMVRLRGNWPAVAGIAALVIGAALAVIAVTVATGGGGRPAPQTRGGVLVTARLEPRTIAFGDRLTARFNVAIDRARVDPEGMHLSANFSPFRPLTPIRVVRRDEGNVSVLTYTVALGCEQARCLPRSMNEKREFTFPPARITFRRRSSVGTFRDLVDVTLPRVGIASRLSFQEIQQSRQANPLRAVDINNRTLTPEDVSGVWRDNAATLPAVSYRMSPSLLAALLIGLAVLLTAGAILLAVRQLRPARRETAVAAEQPVVLTPLEHALDELELALANGHVDQQRKALELVATELGETGEETLAGAARQLAWSEQEPDKPEARALVETVRTSVNGRSDGQQPA